MNELLNAQLMEQILNRIIPQAHIKEYAIVRSTNKRVIVRFKDEHQANITVHNLKRERRLDGNKHPLLYQIERGLKTSHYYLQIAV